MLPEDFLISPPASVQASNPKTSSTRAHAVVEKRYRHTINEKIFQLNERIPNFDGSAVEGQNTNRTAKDRLTKSAVLDRAANYVDHLVRNCEDYEEQCKNIRRTAHHWLKEMESSRKNGSVPQTVSLSEQAGKRT